MKKFEHLTGLEKKRIEKYEEIVEEHINKLDPIGLFPMGTPSNEYRDEIREISLRLQSCKSFLDVAEMIYIVFAYGFGIYEARPRSYYFSVALAIYNATGESI